jgi:hypothetical protein
MPFERLSFWSLAVSVVTLPLIYGLWRFDQSGPLWPDSPRYANAACMIHDAINARAVDSPVEFAKQNYSQYPAFSIPYHPPGYPLSLATWFVVVGESYLAARLFTVICWAVSGLIFAAIQKELGFDRVSAMLSGLLLITTPQLAVWTRDTMSEIPSMVPCLLAVWFWLRWLRTDSWIWCLLGWTMLELAFFTRLSTASIIPCLILQQLITHGFSRKRLAMTAVGSVVFLITGAAWVKVVNKFATDEITADGKGSRFFSAAWEYLQGCSPAVLTSGSTFLAVFAILALRQSIFRVPASRFWLLWLGSVVLFKIAMATSLEVRHFFQGIVAFAGLGVSLLQLRFRSLGLGLVITALIANVLILLNTTPTGMVGYRAVVESITQRDEPGNILLATWEDQDFIFHFRQNTIRKDRFCIRSDRTLAIRVSAYAKREATIIATTQEDVLKLIDRGRISFIVTCSSSAEKSDDSRTQEMRLVHATMIAHPEQFESLGRYPLVVDYVQHAHSNYGGEVQVWRNRLPVLAGPPDLPIIIPTAGMSIQP